DEQRERHPGEGRNQCQEVVLDADHLVVHAEDVFANEAGRRSVSMRLVDCMGCCCFDDLFCHGVSALTVTAELSPSASSHIRPATSLQETLACDGARARRARRMRSHNGPLEEQ